MPFYASFTIGYVIVILFILQFYQQRKYAIALGIVTTAFIVLGYILKPSEFKDQPSVLLNHALSVLAIWLAVYFNFRFKKVLSDTMQHKEKLDAIFSNATEGMLIVNESGEIVLINTFAEKLFGYRGGELVGITIDKLVPERFRFSHKNERQNFMAKPLDRPLGSGRELLAKRKDGSEFPVEISLSHFTKADHTFAIAFILDLTERKKALENLYREQKLALTYFELAPVLFVALDQEGEVISINEYGSHLLGLPKEKVLGKNWFKTFLNPDIQDELFAYFKKIFKGASGELHYENPILTNRKEEIEMSWRNTVIKNMDDQPTIVLCAGTDITERKKHEKLTIAHHAVIQNLNDELDLKIRKRTAELNEAVHKLELVNNELEKKQRLFSAVVHHFPDGVIGALNKDMKYIFADGQELLNIGLSKNDNKGERVFDNIHPALSREAEQRLKDVFSGSRISYDVEINEKAYSINSVPLPDAKGQINEIIVVIKNVTNQKKIEKELLKSIEKEQELNVMKSKFVTMASHEFRTPLTTILSSVFLLENYVGQELESNKTAHLNKIKRSINNLMELLNDFISLGKLEEGRIKVAYSEINISEFLSELTTEMELVRKGNQTIRTEYSGEVTEIILDKQLLRSILTNLIGNAIKYSSANAEIKVNAMHIGNELSIKVIDQGIGIPQEEHRHIFKRFYRAHNAANIDGTGLGLNIAKKYARLMKGKIEFQSKLNEGTTFTVTLPTIKNNNLS